MRKPGNNPEEGAISRWSRLKSAEKERQNTGPDLAVGAVPAGLAADEPPSVAARASRTNGDASSTTEAEAPPIDPADLPDIESLDKTSDFRAFLQDGVPPELRRLALRKLWRINPLFAELDGLNDYDGDYSSMGIVAEKIATLFNPKTGRISRADPVPEPEVDDSDESGAETVESEVEETERPDAAASVEPDDSDADVGDGENDDENV